MQCKMYLYTLAASVILVLGGPAFRVVATPARHARADRVTACGVERWAVKIGMDADARLVNQKVVVPTSIVHMRSMPAPAYLPAHNRLRPVETTVWSVDAILLRYKTEEDSDVHLVLADTGGRTMTGQPSTAAMTLPASASAGKPARRRSERFA
jgi:hypothetical protein